MLRFVFSTIPATGHVNPTLAIVDQLVRRGSKVIYFAPMDLRNRVEEAGALWMDRPRSMRSTPPKGPGLDNEAIRQLPYLMAAAAPRTTPPLADQLAALNPDLVICNELDITARLAARSARRRAATFRPFHAVPRHNATGTPIEADLIDRARSGIENWAARYGLGSVSLEQALRGDEALRLMFLPKIFQAGAEGFDATHLFVGPSISSPSPVPWPFPNQAKQRTLRAYISLGTLRNDKPDFYRLCFEAFPDPEWEVVMSIGRLTDKAALGPIPANFDVRAVAPQLPLLAHTDIFITHGGLNSVMEAVWRGVPMIVLPDIDEQRLTARRIVELGLGLMLEHEGLTAPSLQSAAHHAALDPVIKSNIEAMRAEARAAGGPTRAAEALLEFAETGVWH